MDYDNTRIAVQANKPMLERGLSERIEYALRVNAALYRSLAFARTQTTEPDPADTQGILVLSKKLLTNKDPTTKRVMESLIKKKLSSIQQRQEQTVRQVNEGIYAEFLEAFKSLYMGTKDQIGDNDWGEYQIQDEEGVRKAHLKVAIEEFLEANSWGFRDARVADKLFYLYITSLEKSGVFSFKHQKLTPQELM